MANNISAIKQRMKSIASTQKITNAMKLVSMSKVQQYRNRQKSLEPYFQGVDEVVERFGEKKEAQDAILYVAILPDLSLVSAYTQGMIRYLESLPPGKIMWLGTQGYDQAKKLNLDIMNDVFPSEAVDLEVLINQLILYHNDYDIGLIMPSYGTAISLEFDIKYIDKQLRQDYDVLYEPDYKTANEYFKRVMISSSVYDCYYTSKFSEYTTRRIAMEQATQNADDMIEDLNLQYNRARQEAITQELAELMSGMEG